MGVFGDKFTNQKALLKDAAPALETALGAGGAVHGTPRGPADRLVPPLPRTRETLVDIGSGP